MNIMDKMSFREAQLLVLGSKPEKAKWDIEKAVELNWEQIFSIGDNAEVVGIRLDIPFIVIRMCNGPESLCHIDNFSDKVIDECSEILRGIAANHDWDNHKDELWKIQSNNNPRA